MSPHSEALDAPRREDPVRDLDTLELLGVVALFTFVGTLVFGLIGDMRHAFVFPLVLVATIPMRRWLYRRFDDWSPLGATYAYLAGVIVLSVIVMAVLRALGR